MNTDKEKLLAFLAFLTEEIKPSRLDGYPFDFPERIVNQFIFKIEAAHKLDEEAQAEGFKDAADRATDRLIKEREKQEQEAAAEKKLQEAKDAAAKSLADREAIEQKELELKQMREQADLAAAQKAQREAEQIAQQNINV